MAFSMKQAIDKVTKVTDKMCEIVSIFSMVTIVFLMLTICADVVTGNIFNNPIKGVYEVCQVILTTLVFTSWAYTQCKHGHIHVTMFVSRMPQKLRFFCFAVTSFISTFIMGLATYAVYLNIWEKKASGECTGTLQIPYWPFFLIEAIAFAFFTLILLRDALKATIAIVSSELADEIQASW